MPVDGIRSFDAQSVHRDWALLSSEPSVSHHRRSQVPRRWSRCLLATWCCGFIPSGTRNIWLVRTYSPSCFWTPSDTGAWRWERRHPCQSTDSVHWLSTHGTGAVRLLGRWSLGADVALGVLSVSGHKLGEGQIQCSRYGAQHSQWRIRNAPLNLTCVGSVNVCLCSHCFLRQMQLPASCFDVNCNLLSDDRRAWRHPSTFPQCEIDSPRTILYIEDYIQQFKQKANRQMKKLQILALLFASFLSTASNAQLGGMLKDLKI